MNTTIKPVSDFDKLSEEQRDQLHDWLDEGLGYHKTMARLKDEFGLPITYNKLIRHDKHRLEKRKLSEHLEHEMTMPEYIAVLNGRPVPYADAGLEAIQQAAFEMVHEPKPTAAKLATLQRIFHYKTARAELARREARADQRLAQADRRILQTDRRNDIAQATLDLHTRKFEALQAKPKNGTSQQDGPLGPKARNWKDIGKRAQIMFNLSDEEVARRRALRKAWREDQAKLAAQQSDANQPQTAPLTTEPLVEATPRRNADYQSAPSAPSAMNSTSSSSSAPSANSAASALTPNPVHPVETPSPVTPEDLAKIVDAYTVRRAHEYHDHYRTWADPHSYRKAPPQYITEFRHCPCGHACPCPIHEDEEKYGPFPDWFWTRSPHSPDYACCLRDRDLPYREPKEFLA